MTTLPLTCTGPAVGLGQFGRAIWPASRSSLAGWPLPPGHAVLTHSARTGIALACRAWGLGPGDEVLAPAYNCGCEVDALLSAGVNVRLFRVDRLAQPDWDDCRQRVTARTKLILATHSFGRPLQLNEMADWCRAHGVRLLEDCAHALFTTCAGAPLGAHADAAVFSLTKTLPIPDGGILVMRNADGLPEHFKQLSPAPFGRVFQESLPLLKNALVKRSAALHRCYDLLRARRWRSEAENTESFPDMPRSYYFDPQLRRRRMSALSARLAASCRPAEVVERRRSNYLRLLRQIPRSKGIRPLFDDLPTGTCPLVLPLLAKRRNSICRGLRHCGVDAISFWAGFHRGFTWADFPDAVFLKNHVLALPVHQQLGAADVVAIAAALDEVSGAKPGVARRKPRLHKP